MPRQVERLSAGKVQRTKSEPGRAAMLPDGRGLYLRIGPTGAKSWVLRYQRAGKVRDMGLGPFPDVGLAAAREQAAAQRRIKLEGQDPIEARNSARTAQRIASAKVTTFEDSAKAYIAGHRAGWKSPKSLAAWEGTLRDYAYPILGKLPVAAVDTDLVMKALAPIWTTTPETASRLRGRLESILDYARVIGQRDGENPARWRGHLDHLLPARQAVAKTVHHPALPYRNLPAFVAELREREGVAARALEFAILTAARTGEVIGATWPEIDLDSRLWTIPGQRMKAGREHRVPLSGASLAILGQLDRTQDKPFPVSNMAMLMLLRRMGRGALTAHGFRSTFSDWCAEQTNTPSEVREMALAHAVGDKVEAAYRRGDLFEKRRQLADTWSNFCSGASEDNVVSLRA